MNFLFHLPIETVEKCVHYKLGISNLLEIFKLSSKVKKLDVMNCFRKLVDSTKPTNEEAALS